MKNIRKVNVAVVGCGMISDIYLENITRKFSIFNVVGCCAKSKKSAEIKAIKYNIKALTFEDVLSDKSIEMVINLTPPEAHYDVIKQLLYANKNVYSEKILAVKYEEAEDLVRIANERNLYLGVSPDTFLGSSIQTARQVVDSGMIGEITSCFAAVNRDYGMFVEHVPFVSKPGGGVGFDVGIYYMTALVSILGAVKEVSGFLKTNRKIRKHYFVRNDNFDDPYEIECENVMVGSLLFENGVLGNVHFNSENIMNERPHVVIYGTEGIIYMSDPNTFGGEVSVVRKGHEEPFVIQQNFGFAENCRGLGAAEMAWAMRRDRKHRANKEMALNALEALHGIAISSETKSNYILKSTFEKLPQLPQGYLDTTYFNSDPEAALEK